MLESLIGAAGGIASSLLQSSANRRANAQSLFNQRAINREADQYQRNLISDLATLNKQAYEKAGLSVAALTNPQNSASSNVSSSAPAVLPDQAPDFNNALIAGAQLKNANSQAKVNDANASKTRADEMYINSQKRGQDLENANAKLDFEDKLARGMKLSEDAREILPSLLQTMSLDEDGNAVFSLDYKKYKDVLAKMPKYMSADTFAAYLGIPVQEAQARLSALQADKVRFEGDKKVAELRNNDTSIQENEAMQTSVNNAKTVADTALAQQTKQLVASQDAATQTDTALKKIFAPAQLAQIRSQTRVNITQAGLNQVMQRVGNANIEKIQAEIYNLAVSGQISLKELKYYDQNQMLHKHNSMADTALKIKNKYHLSTMESIELIKAISAPLTGIGIGVVPKLIP